MDEAELWNRRRRGHRNRRSGLDGAGGVIDRLIGKVRRIWIGAVIASAIPSKAKTLRGDLIHHLDARAFDAAQHGDIAMRQNFAESPSVHSARNGHPRALG